MKRGSKSKLYSALGGIIFFLTVAVTVSIALIVYESVNDRGEYVWLAMIGVILAISLAFSVIDYFRRYIMVKKPTARILEAAERMASGDFSVRLDIAHLYERYDEYDLIMDDLNKLARALEHSEILKNDFISNISHELKTPLALISNYAELISRPGLSDEERLEYSSALMRAAKRLTALVGNILKLTKLENGELELENERFRADELLAECVLVFEEKIEEKELELSLDIDEFSVVSSESKLEIVFNNLISNAVKFTPRGGSVTVSLKKHGEDAVFTVSDTGIGISREAGERIFEKFYQIDGSHSSEGNGLGLALVKRVVDILGGDINVESVPGEGSSFSVILRSCVE